jgi:hypothetical protein
MIYNYDDLEDALNFAAGRVPLSELLKLIGEVEHVITTRDNGRTLEQDIYLTVDKYKSGPPKGSTFKTRPPE